jgi:hypothetical protein
MLRQNGKKIMKAFNVRYSVFTTHRLSSSSKKSWTPSASEDALLQRITTQALILDMNNHMNASSALTVPWFLKQMPVAYFTQISEERRKQHLQAVIAIRDLQQLNLSLQLESKGEEGSSEVTFINTQTQTGNLYSQIKNLSVPEGSNLARVRVYSSLDNSLALNVFSFDSSTKGKRYILLVLLSFCHVIFTRHLFIADCSICTYAVLAGPLGDRFCNPHVVIFVLSKHHHHHHHQKVCHS